MRDVFQVLSGSFIEAGLPAYDFGDVATTAAATECRRRLAEVDAKLEEARRLYLEHEKAVIGDPYKGPNFAERKAMLERARTIVEEVSLEVLPLFEQSERVLAMFAKVAEEMVREADLKWSESRAVAKEKLIAAGVDPTEKAMERQPDFAAAKANYDNARARVNAVASERRRASGFRQSIGASAVEDVRKYLIASVG